MSVREAIEKPTEWTCSGQDGFLVHLFVGRGKGSDFFVPPMVEYRWREDGLEMKTGPFRLVLPPGVAYYIGPCPGKWR